MDFSKWPDYWEALSLACNQHCSSSRSAEENSPIFKIAPPATEAEVKAVEDLLEIRLPQSLREVLLGYSAKVDISWELPDGVKPPKPFHGIFAGKCCWDLSQLSELQKGYQSWVDECFSNPDDPYDAIWHDKLAIAEVGDGDMIGIDLNSPTGAVVYLCHDGCQEHGYRLGDSFADFVDRYARIGCPGLECWQWVPFTNGPTSLIDPDGPNAKAWRKWFGLQLQLD